MKLTLFSQQEFSTLILPEKIAGRYWVRGKNTSGKMTDIIAVEAVRPTDNSTSPHWIIKSNRRFKLIDGNHNVMQGVVVAPNELYKVNSADGKIKFALGAELLSDDCKSYSGYEIISRPTALKIGRDFHNDISYSSNLVSSTHTALEISSDSIVVHDMGSANGTYVNGKAVTKKTLSVGDTIYIMGLQIIVANNYLFINNPDGNVTIKSSGLKKYHVAPAKENTADLDVEDEFEDVPDDFYYRAPRFKLGVETFELKLDAPPASQINEEVPLLMQIGPSMTMGLAALTMGGFALSNALGDEGNLARAMPQLVMSLSMLLGTLL